MALTDIRSEIPRTFIHILGGFLLAGTGYFFDPPLNLILLGGVLTGVIIMEGFRLIFPRVNRWTRFLIGPFMRPHEDRSITGAPAFFGGVFLTFLLFQRSVAVAAMVPLIFGDRAGLLAGKAIGRIHIGEKTLEGSLACFAASFLAYLALSGLWPDLFGYDWVILLSASLIGTLAEALPRPFDDNLIIPLAVGVFLSFVT
jgi:dolichol kinase